MPRAQGVSIEVAGVPVRIVSHSPELLYLVASRPAWLAETEACRPAMIIVYTLDPSAGVRPGHEAPEISIRRSGVLIGITGDDFNASVDLATGLVHATGPLSLAPIDTVLRAALPELIDDALLLHCCVLTGDDGAWVCSGPSGAGKSTLLSLLPDRAVGDELAVLHRHRGAPYVRPLWTSGDHRGPLAVDRIFLLGHGGHHSRRKADPRDAFRRLARETNWPVTGAGATRRTFMLLGWLIERTPVWDLRFTPEPGVLETLRR